MFRELLEFFAGGFNVREKIIGLAQQIADEFHGSALAERGEQPFFRARIPQAIQCVTHLATGNAEADVLGGDTFHRVRFVEDDEVVFEQNAAFLLFAQTTEQREEQRVIQNQNVGGQNFVARALKKADGMILAEIGLIPADFRRAKAAFRANQRPNFGVRLDVKIRKASVLRFLGPLVNAPQFLAFG